MTFFSAQKKKPSSDQPIFLDDSKRRKWYFRVGIIFAAFFLLGASAIFLFGIVAATGKRTPITYENAIERYHYYYSPANSKKLAFSFDDGPNGDATLDIVKALKEADAPATFFFIGKRALVRPDLVEKVAGAGFDVEDHSFTHGQDVDSSYTRLAIELNSTNYILSEVSGKEIGLYRPPYLLGIGIDPTINPYIPVSPDMQWALQLGYLPIGSDIDSKDWLASSPEAVVEGLKTALAATPNGHIMLFHDDPNTAKAIPAVLAYLKSQGYEIVPLKELLTPPSGADMAFAADLRYGDTDQKTDGAVSKLQWFLYKQKFLDAYALSGVYDSATRDAVTEFQIKNKLIDPGNPRKSAGVLGPQTREAVLAAAVGAAPSSAEGPHGLFGSSALDFAHDWSLAAYVNLFPVVRSVLQIGLMLALAMVLLRTFGLVCLLLYRSVKGLDRPREPAGEEVPVSILIPAYNEQENIAVTVESIIRTAHKNREIIVIDDGSKDETAKEVEGVIARHPEEHIRLISVENGGKARALNIGTKEAAHDIIVVLDADAVLDPMAVSYFLPHFSDEKVAAVAGRVRTTNSSNLLDLFQTLEYAIGQNIDKAAFSTINAIGVVPGPAGAWRKSFLLEAGGFHVDTLVEDQEMTLSALHAGKKVVYEPRSVAYTETPHSIKNFLKQRFRWVYGTMQCFWKHKKVMYERPASSMSLVVMPNIFIYNILLPLTYPLADSALLFGLIFGEWTTLILPFAIFTAVDLLYAVWGLRGEPNKAKLLLAVPMQRVVYRQLLYYTVYKGVIRAIEGSGMGWNKFTKTGETRRFYLAAMGSLEAALEKVETAVTALELHPAEPAVAAASMAGAGATIPLASVMDVEASAENIDEVMALTAVPRHFQREAVLAAPGLSSDDGD